MTGVAPQDPEDHNQKEKDTEPGGSKHEVDPFDDDFHRQNRFRKADWFSAAGKGVVMGACKKATEWLIDILTNF